MSVAEGYNVDVYLGEVCYGRGGVPGGGWAGEEKRRFIRNELDHFLLATHPAAALNWRPDWLDCAHREARTARAICRCWKSALSVPLRV